MLKTCVKTKIGGNKENEKDEEARNGYKSIEAVYSAVAVSGHAGSVCDVFARNEDQFVRVDDDDGARQKDSPETLESLKCRCNRQAAGR